MHSLRGSVSLAQRSFSNPARGVLGCWSVGVLECWSVGVLECWSVGVLECWSVGVLECWSVGVLECWSVGVLECWSVGVLECWSVGSRPVASAVASSHSEGNARSPPAYHLRTGKMIKLGTALEGLRMRHAGCTRTWAQQPNTPTLHYSNTPPVRAPIRGPETFRTRATRFTFRFNQRSMVRSPMRKMNSTIRRKADRK